MSAPCGCEPVLHEARRSAGGHTGRSKRSIPSRSAHLALAGSSSAGTSARTRRSNAVGAAHSGDAGEAGGRTRGTRGPSSQKGAATGVEPRFEGSPGEHPQPSAATRGAGGMPLWSKASRLVRDAHAEQRGGTASRRRLGRLQRWSKALEGVSVVGKQRSGRQVSVCGNRRTSGSEWDATSPRAHGRSNRQGGEEPRRRRRDRGAPRFTARRSDAARRSGPGVEPTERRSLDNAEEVA